MDDNTPATKGDLRLLSERMDADFGILTKRMDTDFGILTGRMEGAEGAIKGLKVTILNLTERMDHGFQRVHEGIDQVLTVLVNVDKRLQGQIDNHEVRISELEKAAA